MRRYLRAPVLINLIILTVVSWTLGYLTGGTLSNNRLTEQINSLQTRLNHQENMSAALKAGLESMHEDLRQR